MRKVGKKNRLQVSGLKTTKTNAVGQNVKACDEAANQRAYGRLKSMILSRKTRLQEHLVEATLANDVGLSRTPVREALRRLESEGLVEHKPGKGWRPTFLDKDDLREIFELKILLETEAAACAARLATPEICEELLTMSQRMLSTAGSNDPESWLELDRKFHMVLLQAANNKRLAQAVNNLNDQWWRVQVGVMAMTRRMADSAREHVGIASAIASHDAPRACQLTREHVMRVRDSVQQTLEATFAVMERVP